MATDVRDVNASFQFQIPITEEQSDLFFNLISVLRKRTFVAIYNILFTQVPDPINSLGVQKITLYLELYRARDLTTTRISFRLDMKLTSSENTQDGISEK
jgi:hypothetical protein